MEPLKIFDQFKLEELDKSWVKAIWNNEFIIFDPLPDNYILYVESNVKEMETLLRDTTIVMKRWIQENRDQPEDSVDPELSWQTLSGLEIDVKALLALLGSLMKTGQDREYDEDARQCCLLATSMYLTLLSIPGSNVYQVFHENLYQRTLDTLRLSECLVPPVKKPKRSQELEHLYEEEEEGNSLSNSEKKVLTQGLNTIMYDVVLLLESFSLADLPRSLEATVTALIEVTKLGTESSAGPASRKNCVGTLTTLSNNAYAALSKICHERHGSIDITVKLIIKNVVTFMTHNCYNTLPTKLLANVREATVMFLSKLMREHGEVAESGVAVLIDLMMINCSKIADERKREVGLIIELLELCQSRNVKVEIVTDFLRFARNNKPLFRLFAQEIFSRYLLRGCESSGGNSELINIRKVVLATVLCHCHDASSLVRARALSTISDYTRDLGNLFVAELFQSSDRRRDVPTIDDLEEALSDISGGVNILPDVDTMISLLGDRVEDERASVRISAIQVLRNAVLLSPELLPNAMKIISNHCRDPTMTVRMCSIQTLTSLFEAYPDHANFHTVWAKAVVPQVFDVEIKVQIEVLKALESLTIRRIVSPTQDDKVPWRVLQELTGNKMRKHLAKACDAWVQDGTLSNSMVRRIQSFINTEHNIAAWILLSAIAEARVLPNMKEHFVNYQELLTSSEFLEPVFEVLRSCWTEFDLEFQEVLYEDFLKYLSEFHVSSGLISISLDIIYEIAQHMKSNKRTLEKSFEEEMRDLMVVSENFIERIMDEACDEQICIRAIYTLGHASLLCTREVKISVLRVLQGFLIERETIPGWIANSRELQATTIVVLGQQSMRKETIAHEMMTIFAQLLCSNSGRNAEDAAIRVNAAKALADVCTRFTALVEPYLPDMCISMKDSNSVVREAIVVIFIQLLVEDFIKVKGTFFFHILTMLSDENETIREMTIFLIKERLLMKNKDLISQQFLESIFHYNDCELQNKFLRRKMRTTEKNALTLPGTQNEAKRRMIYDFMLENLEPSGKLKLIGTLTTQIFNGVLSGVLKIKRREAACVLRDALYVIGSDHLQASSCSNRQSGDEENEDGTPAVSAPIKAIIEKIKDHMLRVLLPTLTELRRRVKGSALEPEVGRAFMRIISEFHKDQLAALYGEFPQVEREAELNARLYGKRGDVEEEADDTPLGESTPIKPPSHPLISNNRTPRIVLRRLSSLTYPGTNLTENPVDEASISRAVSTPVVVLTDCVRELNLINTLTSSKQRGSKRRFE